MVLKDETRFQVCNSTELKSTSRIFIGPLTARRTTNGVTQKWCCFFVSRESGMPRGETQSVQYQHCQAPTISDIAPKKNKTSSPNLRHWLWLPDVFKRFSVYHVVKWSSFTSTFQMGWSHHSSYLPGRLHRFMEICSRHLWPEVKPFPVRLPTNFSRCWMFRSWAFNHIICLAKKNALKPMGILKKKSFDVTKWSLLIFSYFFQVGWQSGQFPGRFEC